MNNELFIGLHGKIRVGKNTAADYLCERHSLVHIAFADPIRAMLVAMTELNPIDFDRERKEINIPVIGASPRRLMQTLGTEWGRDMVNHDLWVKLAGIKVMRLRAEFREVGEIFHGAVFSDVRFQNELEFVHELGGHILHILRVDEQVVDTHPSNVSLPITPVDLVISNNGSLCDFYDRLEMAVAEVYA